MCIVGRVYKSEICKGREQSNSLCLGMYSLRCLRAVTEGFDQRQQSQARLVAVKEFPCICAENNLESQLTIRFPLVNKTEVKVELIILNEIAYFIPESN